MPKPEVKPGKDGRSLSRKSSRNMRDKPGRSGYNGPIDTTKRKDKSNGNEDV